MTTPEKFRRRQRLEGIALLILALAVSVSVYYFDHQDDEQRACVAENFSDLASTLAVRGDLSTKEARADQIESSATRQLFDDAFAASDEADFLAAYTRYQAGLAKADRKRARVAEVRAANPFPAFPEGSCSAD